MDEFPEVYRFTTAVFPSADDDVITSPYNRLNQISTSYHFQCTPSFSNSVLALHELTEKADCVLPVENQV